MIERIGIELEGGWDEIPEGAEIIQDLSIDGRTLPTDSRLVTNHVGEIVSPPLEPMWWQDWINKHYPSKVNITCGLHVHVSFTTKGEYALMMSRAYHQRVIAAAKELATSMKLHETHYIWERLAGGNPFALFQVLPSEQVYVREKRIGMRSRYAAFNYCFSMHGTLEYRVLPMFPEGVDTCKQFIHSFLKVTEAFLAERKQLTFKKKCALRERDGAIEERIQ